MSLAKLPMKVFEYFPKDFKQMNDSLGTGYLAQLKHFLLSSSQKECLKFYKFDNQFFIESENDVHFLESKKAQGYYNYFLSDDGDFYSDVVFGEDYFQIDGVYFRLINCYDFPDTISPFALSRLGDQVISLSRLSQDLSENEGLFEVEMWFILKGHSEDELNIKTQGLLSSLKAVHIVPLIETKLTFEVILPGIFFGVPTAFKMTHLLTATYVTSLLPFDREFLFKDDLELLTIARKNLSLNLKSDNVDNMNNIESCNGGIFGLDFLFNRRFYSLVNPTLTT